MPADDVPDRDAAFGVRLGIEERLHVSDPVRVGSRQIREGEVAEVGPRPQHGAGRVVHVEERLQVRELDRRRPHFLRGGIRQPNVVSLGQFERELGLERAFEVNVELHLWQALDQREDLRGEGTRKI